MSTSWYGTMDMPTAMDPEDALAIFEETRQHVGWRGDADLGPFHIATITDGIGVSLPADAQPDADGPEPRIVDGRLVASLAFSNLEREVASGDQADGGSVHARLRMDVHLECLTRLCSAPVGAFVGTMMCENDEGDASPLVVTPEGVRILRTDGNHHLSYSFGYDPEEFPPQESVPADLLVRQDDWYWEIDLAALRKRLRVEIVCTDRA